MFTSTKFQNIIKEFPKKGGKEGKKKDENKLEFFENNFKVFLSKIIPTVIWSAIQLALVIAFALIYMSYKCEDFAMPDSWDKADGTHESACTAEIDGNPDPKSTLCALFAPCRSSAFRRGTIPSRRPSRKFESALWLSIVTMTTVG